MATNTICLWYDGSAEEAARFYADTFPDSAVGNDRESSGRQSVHQGGRGHHGGIHRGSAYRASASTAARRSRRRGVPFQVLTRDQAETDRYWNAIVGNGGAESMCGLVQGQVGGSGRSPRASSPKRCPIPTAQRPSARSRRMMEMRKIDVAKIDAALAKKTSRHERAESLPRPVNPRSRVT